MSKNISSQFTYKKYFFSHFLNKKLIRKLHKVCFLKLIFIFLILFSNVKNNFANSEYSNIKKYVNNSKDLNSKKRTSQILSSKSKGQEIKYFLKKNSEIQSRKAKNKLAAEKMEDSGVTTKNMVKKNRWFVKKPFQKSYKKISSIKRITPPQVDAGENKKISLMASELTKTRARETGPTKPEFIFSGDSSRSAQKMSKTLTKEAAQH